MTRELRVVLVLIILMAVSFAGWKIVESRSVLRSHDFLRVQTEPLNPTLETSVLAE